MVDTRSTQENRLAVDTQAADCIEGQRSHAERRCLHIQSVIPVDSVTRQLYRYG